MTTAAAPSGRWEQAAGSVLPVVLGAGVFAVAFVHVHDVAVWAGQPGWAAYLIAMTGEAMAIAALAAIAARRRIPGASISWPAFVLVSAVLFSGACNLAAVTHRPGPHHPPDAGPIVGQPGPWVGLMAVWPVVAFGLVAGLKATKPTHPAEADPAVAVAASTMGTTPAHPAAAASRPSGAGGTSPGGGHTPLRAPDITPSRPPATPPPDLSAQREAAAPLAAAWARVGDAVDAIVDGRDDGHIGEHITTGGDRSELARAADSAHPERPAPFLPLLPVEADRFGAPVGAGEMPPAPAVGSPFAPPRVSGSVAGGALPRAAAVEFRPPAVTAGPSITEGLGVDGEPDVSDLLPDGRKIRASLTLAGEPLNRRTLHAGLKEHGHKAGTRKLDALLALLRQPELELSS